MKNKINTLEILMIILGIIIALIPVAKCIYNGTGGDIWTAAMLSLSIATLGFIFSMFHFKLRILEKRVNLQISKEGSEKKEIAYQIEGIIEKALNVKLQSKVKKSLQTTNQILYQILHL